LRRGDDRTLFWGRVPNCLLSPVSAQWVYCPSTVLLLSFYCPSTVLLLSVRCPSGVRPVSRLCRIYWRPVGRQASTSALVPAVQRLAASVDIEFPLLRGCCEPDDGAFFADISNQNVGVLVAGFNPSGHALDDFPCVRTASGFTLKFPRGFHRNPAGTGWGNLARNVRAIFLKQWGSARATVEFLTFWGRLGFVAQPCCDRFMMVCP
jgi:hypothetical protein